MANRVQFQRVLCEGGLNSSDNHSVMSEHSPGSAVHLVNYESSYGGGYRRINGYVPLDATYAEIDPSNSKGPVLGLAFFRKQESSESFVIAARKIKSFEFVVSDPNQIAFSGTDKDNRSMDLPFSDVVEVFYKEVGTTVESLLFEGSDYIVLDDLVTLQPTFRYALQIGDTIVVDPNEYKYYSYDGTSYTALNAVIDPTKNNPEFYRFRASVSTREVSRIRSVEFNSQGSDGICFVDGINPAVIYDGSKWTQLTISESGDMVLTYPSICSFFENHLFLSGDWEFPKLISNSAPNDPYNFKNVDGAERNVTSSDIVQIKPFRDSLYIFGASNIQKLIVGRDDKFEIKQVTSNMGCIARDSVVEIAGDLLFLAPDGFRPVAGTARIGDVEISSISHDIHDFLLTAISRHTLSDLCAVVINQKSHVRYFFTGNDGGSVENAFGLNCCLRKVGGSPKWEFMELMGIRANVGSSGYLDKGKNEVVLHGDYDGRVYQQEVGTSFDGKEIFSVYTTPYLDFGQSGSTKGFRHLEIFYGSEDNFEMNVGIKFDWGDLYKLTPSSYRFLSDSTHVEYNGENVTYDNANTIYGDRYDRKSKFPIEGSGRSIRVRLVNKSKVSEPFSIHSLLISHIQGVVR